MALELDGLSGGQELASGGIYRRRPQPLALPICIDPKHILVVDPGAKYLRLLPVIIHTLGRGFRFRLRLCPAVPVGFTGPGPLPLHVDTPHGHHGIHASTQRNPVLGNQLEYDFCCLAEQRQLGKPEHPSQPDLAVQSLQGIHAQENLSVGADHVHGVHGCFIRDTLVAAGRVALAGYVNKVYPLVALTGLKHFHQAETHCARAVIQVFEVVLGFLRRRAIDDILNDFLIGWVRLLSSHILHPAWGTCAILYQVLGRHLELVWLAPPAPQLARADHAWQSGWRWCSRADEG
mmetsp:Transcript_39069/g.110676  ORF Transcript_39069/g.110676 Transcript_39069/m.110676 type:complete len:291 (-) Transcript_39069:574-1446(-)